MFEKEITAGMRLLDEKMPGWHTRVSVENLRMSNCTFCVLGQLTGDYWSARASGLLETSRWSTAHHARAQVYGFAVKAGTADELDERHRQLTAEWREAIEKRRGEAR